MLLQAAVPTHTITTLRANHEAKWREYSLDDFFVDSCHWYLTNLFYLHKHLDPVSDPWKLQQLIAGIFYYTHQIRNMSRDWQVWQESLDE